ncbi:MAG: rRNA maturation RNase YbeY [Bradymonadia bacterium]
MMPRVSITLRSHTKGRFAGSSYRSRVKRVLEVLGLKSSELSILLTDDEEIRVLNREFRHKDRPTDVLSFGQEAIGGPTVMRGGASVRVLGDIVLSLETLERQANSGCLERLKPTLGERAERWSCLDEATFLSLHGILHLIGYDHESPAEAEEMEALEAEILFSVLRHT